MPVTELISVEEYLGTTFRPDCDYVDGEVLERNLGELSHGRLQGNLFMWLRLREKSLRIKAVVEVRLRVNDRRFRIPDVMVIAADAPVEEIVITPPLLCIEVLSPRDTLKTIWDRSKDYLVMGVPVCWIIDPVARAAWTITSTGLLDVTDGVLRASEIEMPLAEVFE